MLPWSTEATMKKLLESTNDTNKILYKVYETKFEGANSDLKAKYDGLRKSVQEQTDVSEKVKKSGQNILTGAMGLSKAQKGAADAADETAEETKKSGVFFNRSLQNFAGGLVDGRHTAGGAITGLAGSLLTLVEEGTFVGLAFEGVVKVLEMVVERFEGTSKSLLELDDVGQGFGLSLTGYTDLLYKSGVKASEFNKEITSHSAAAAFLGIQQTAKLTNSFSQLTKRGSELLMTNEDARDLMLDYTDTIRLAGDLQGRSTTKLTTDAAAFGTELNKVTEITGQNRKELEKNIKAQFLETNFQLAISTLPQAIKDNMLNKVLPSINLVFGTEANGIKDALGGYISRGFAGMNPAMVQALNQSGAFDAFQQMAEIAKAGGDTTEAMKALGKQLSNPESIKRLQQFAYAGGAAGEAANELLKIAQASRNAVQGLDANGNKISAEQKAALEVQAKTKVALDKLSIAFDRLILNLVPVLIPAMDMFGKAVVRIADAVMETSGFIDDFGAFFKELTGAISKSIDTFIQGNAEVKKFIDGVSNITSWIMEHVLKPFGKLAGEIFTGITDWIKKIPGMEHFDHSGNKAQTPEEKEKEKKHNLVSAGIVGGGVVATGVVGKGIFDLAGGILNGTAKLLGLGGGKAAAKVGEEGVKVASKFGLEGAAKLGGKLAGRFIPGVGVVLDTAGAASQFSKGNALSGSLYAAGAATGALATGLDATGIGAVAGVPLGLLSGGLGLAGLATEGAGKKNENKSVDTTIVDGPKDVAEIDMNQVVKATLHHYTEVQKANKQMILLLTRCETALDILGSATARGHENMVSALKKSGNSIY
jgi:hypothetical protein